MVSMMDGLRALADPQKRKYVIACVAVAFVGALVLMVFSGKRAATSQGPAFIELSYRTTGEVCVDSGDCLSKSCKRGVCAAPSCRDGVHNGEESDVDCGGYCRLCDTKHKCNTKEDCVSGVCGTMKGQPSTVCLPPSCSDKVRNGHETDVDCGGEMCRPCAPGKMCAAAADCKTKLCNSRICVNPSCVDGKLNEDETDVDCGGDVCNACGTGKKCNEYTDCQSLVCTDGVCQAPTCDDDMSNGEETDMNCGGPVCPPCESGQYCSEPRDCKSGICDMEWVAEGEGSCAAPSCSDGKKNGDESDVDCGGEHCVRCRVGGGCGDGGDCTSFVCKDGLCIAATCSDSIMNGLETDVDCGGGVCDGCPNGKYCEENDDCSSGYCEATAGGMDDDDASPSDDGSGMCAEQPPAEDTTGGDDDASTTGSDAGSDAGSNTGDDARRLRSTA